MKDKFIDDDIPSLDVLRTLCPFEKPRLKDVKTDEELDAADVVGPS